MRSLHFTTNTLFHIPPPRSSTVIFWTEIRCWRKIYVASGLKSSLQTSQGCTDELVDRYKIAIPQLAIDIFLLYVGFYILYHQQEFYLKFELRVIQPVSYSAACVLFYSRCLILQPVSYSTACVLFETETAYPARDFDGFQFRIREF